METDYLPGPDISAILNDVRESGCDLTLLRSMVRGEALGIAAQMAVLVPGDDALARVVDFGEATPLAAEAAVSLVNLYGPSMTLSQETRGAALRLNDWLFTNRRSAAYRRGRNRRP